MDEPRHWTTVEVVLATDDEEDLLHMVEWLTEHVVMWSTSTNDRAVRLHRESHLTCMPGIPDWVAAP